MAKLNIFISQPMHGLSEREILAERDRIEEVLHKLFPNDELEFLSGYTSEAPHCIDETQERIYRLGCSISIMAEADYVFFPCGYMGAEGCMVEWNTCFQYDIPYIKEVPRPQNYQDEAPSYRYEIHNFGGNRV